MAHGLDLASGLHNLLRDEPILVAEAMAHGRRLHDVRVPPQRYPIADGKRRSGRRCLAVGTDCSVGKMYTALAMEREMRARGMAATFRATGQTGILITGGGVPLDAVVADFMAGSIEWLTPDNDPDHWDLIEGQGSLFHASYSGVTLALIHGGQPDALVLCHEPTRAHMRGLPGFRLPTLEALRDLSLTMAAMVNPDVTRHRHLDQHRGDAEGRGARLPRRGRGADGAADGRSVPAGRGAAGGRAANEAERPAPTPSRSRGRSRSAAARAPRRGCLTVTLEDAGYVGRGECVPYARYGETPESVAAAIEGAARALDRLALQDLLPPGRGAQRGRLRALGPRGEAERPAGLAARRACRSRGRRSPRSRCRSTRRRRCAPRRRANAERPLLKVKLGGEGDMARLEAVRAGAPRARIVVDANEGWSAEVYAGARPGAGRGSAWRWSSSRCPPAPTTRWPRWRGRCRSAPTRAATTGRAWPALAGKYDMVNVKLDKAGGLTEALALRDAARAAGFGDHGRLHGRTSSLAMAPAVLVAQGAAVADLDGPLLLAADRAHAARATTRGACIRPTPELWG